jgi:hypothetical protein
LIKIVPNNNSLKRILSSDNASKYQLIGKFLPSTSSPVASATQATPNHQTTTQVAPATQADLSSTSQVVFSNSADPQDELDLLDNLVNRTILNRDASAADASAAQGSVQFNSIQAPSRAKENLANAVPQENVTEQAVEQAAEQVVEQINQAEAAVKQETASNPEMAELSQELKEVGQEVKEQREQSLIQEKQQEINNLVANATTPVAVSDKPVVVLPITAQSKEEAKFKSTKYSVRWLLEWCVKVAKIFSGAVVYKEEVEDV